MRLNIDPDNLKPALRMFRDRKHASEELGRSLERFRNEETVILGLARGGVVLAVEIARALGAPWDVLVARKVGAPLHSELGIGAVAPGGIQIFDTQIMARLGVSADEFRVLARRAKGEMEDLLQLYRTVRPALELKDRTVILVDDGLATGMTALAALRSVRKQGPRRVIFAAPVCSPEAVKRLKTEYDAVLCLTIPDDFFAVAPWFEQFDQLDDAQVMALLRE